LPYKILILLYKILILLSLFDICKVSLLGTLQNIAGWDGITEITSEGQFEMHERIKHGYAPC